MNEPRRQVLPGLKASRELLARGLATVKEEVSSTGSRPPSGGSVYTSTMRWATARAALLCWARHRSSCSGPAQLPPVAEDPGAGDVGLCRQDRSSPTGAGLLELQ